MLIARRQNLSDREGLLVAHWADCRDMGMTDPEKVTHVAKLLGLTPVEIRRFLRDFRIQQAILYEESVRDYEHGCDTTNVLRMVSRMTYWDPALLVNGDDEPIPLHKLPEEIRAAIQGIKVTYNRDGSRTVDYKMVDRIQALERLMKHLGLFEKDNAQKGSVFQEMLEEVYKDSSRIPVKAQILDAEQIPYRVPEPGEENVPEKVRLAPPEPEPRTPGIQVDEKRAHPYDFRNPYK